MPLAPAITDLEQLKDRPVLSALLAWNQSAVQEARFDRNELTIYVARETIRPACTQLKSQGLIDFLSDLTCADYYPRDPRFEIAYHLLSIKRKERVRLKVRLMGDDAGLESITSLWPAADFFEREVYDLFGVRFLGHRSDVVGLMQAADAFVMPASYEPFGLVLMEAMSCGTPVITSRAAGVAELMTDGREGYTVEDPFDVVELVRTLGTLLGRRSQWPELSAAARALALEWDWDSIWRRTEALYRELLAGKRAGIRKYPGRNASRRGRA